MKRSWKLLLLAVYGAGMLWLLFGQRVGQNVTSDWQGIPFHTLRIFFNMLIQYSPPELRWEAWKNLVGNVLLFVPLGAFVPWIWPVWRKFWRQLLLMIGLIIAVELSQVLFGLGWCDVDDLLLNVIGTSLGYLLWKCICKIRR